MRLSMQKIDLVYLWVDGNSQEFLNQKAKFSQNNNETCIATQGKCRYRDNQELKYSLRSVAKNAPWINKIFIVTNGQIPDWLDTSNPKIKIINHKEIMPAAALPTFNSEAIESCIVNIPELSEYFLYANDDMFIAKPISPNYFFDKNSNPIIRLNPHAWTEEELELGLYGKNITNVLKIIKSKYGKDFPALQPTHNIDAYRKSYFKECIEVFKNEFTKVCYQRFRAENSAQRFIVSLYMICVKNCSYKIFKTEAQQRENLYLTAKNSPAIANILKRNKTTLFCINDDQYTSQEETDSTKFYLSKLYPYAQEWEKNIDIQIEPIDKNARTIVFAPDNNYFKYFAVALQSVICNSSPNEMYDIIILDSDITENNKILLNKNLPKNFSIRYFNMRNYIQENYSDISLKVRSYWSESTYYKCFIPLVMKNYKKVLFLDADICVAQNLSNLFDLDFENNQIIAVRDTVSGDLFAHKVRKCQLIEDLGLTAPETYFNAGVVYFNNSMINPEEYRKQLKNVLQNINILFQDQDILNVIFKDSKKLISCKYNCQYGVTIFNDMYIGNLVGEYKEDFLKARENPVIIHYTSSRKPWHSPSEFLADVFWEYAGMSPFYEIILYDNLVNQNTYKRDIKNILSQKSIYFKYYLAKWAAAFSFGKIKKQYKHKRMLHKKRVQEIRELKKT